MNVLHKKMDFALGDVFSSSDREEEQVLDDESAEIEEEEESMDLEQVGVSLS